MQQFTANLRSHYLHFKKVSKKCTPKCKKNVQHDHLITFISLNIKSVLILVQVLIKSNVVTKFKVS